MVFLNNLPRHTEWRKIAKKLRRKRIRQVKAKERDNKLLEEQKRLEDHPHYQRWLQEQETIEEEQEREEAVQTELGDIRWAKVEVEAQKQWQELQKKIALAREEKMKQNMKIKLEWEQEEQRLKEIQRAKEKELEEKRVQQVKREKELLDFLEQGGDTPEHLDTQMETNPGKPICPFFKKVSACRFFDVCSRNHVRPGISRTILITNFFSHMSMEIKENEHGSDSCLEFEKEDTYKLYKEFFYDVVSELEKCGKIKIFLTCCNHELHLRGNVYVQYKSTREALVSYHKFNGRWYGGKQLNVEFCSLSSWDTAICGLFFRNKCPKGNSCNFLHIFPNPRNLYMDTASGVMTFRSRRTDFKRSSRRKDDFEDDSWDREASERRNWRWSESPEPVPKPHNNDGDRDQHRENGKRSRDQHNRRDRDRDDDREYIRRDGDRYRNRTNNASLSSRRSDRQRKRSRSSTRKRSRSKDKLSSRRKRRSRSKETVRSSKRSTSPVPKKRQSSTSSSDGSTGS